jgi:epoxyqueuosine reductase
VCPWNRYGQLSTEDDFAPRKNLKDQELITLFNWSEEAFLKNTEGSPIRRIGFERWQRNLAVGLGNAPFNEHIIDTLEKAHIHSTELVKEHIEWALEQQRQKQIDTDRKKARLIRIIEKGLPRDA